MNKILFCQSLRDHLTSFNINIDEPNYELVTFWGAAKERGVKVDASCLSNHFIRNFTYQDITFNSVEQGMMYMKAKLFNDDVIAEKIMQEKHPVAQKRLGRQVRGFNMRVWDHYKYGLVKGLCLAKFQQHEDFKEWLLNHPDNVLFVEASPFDRIWGVELPFDAPEIKDISKWRGENLLGFIHTENFRTLKGLIK